MASNEYKDVVKTTTQQSGKKASSQKSYARSGKKTKEEISLKSFLEYISNEVSPIQNINNICNDKEKALTAIIKVCKARKFVGAAVGGLLINHEKNEVLLYLRPKDPEKYKWSMPGGSIEFENDATKALIKEYDYITGITLKSENLLPLRITNHIAKSSSCNYHYLSPAFTIKNPNDFLSEINGKINKTKKLNEDEIKKLASNFIQDIREDEENAKEVLIETLIEDIKSGNYFLKDWERELKQKLSTQKYPHYIVKWFKINDVIDTDKISEPTKRALKSYQNRIKTIDDIANRTQEILTKAAIDADKIVKEATETTHTNIRNIHLEKIIQTDD